MYKYLFAAFLLFSLFVPTADAQLVSVDRLVPECPSISFTDSTGAREVRSVCTACHLFQLIQRLLSFLYLLTIPILIVWLVYGGYLMIYGAVSAGARDKGKKAILHALLGIIIIFGSWLFIDTILKILTGAVLTNPGPAIVPQLSSGQSLGFGPWNQIECGTFTFPAPPPSGGGQPQPTPGGGSSPLPGGAGAYVPNPNERALAQRVLDEIGFTTISSCGGVSGLSTIQAVAGGTAPPVCSPGCIASTPCPPGNVHISMVLMDSILIMRAAGLDFGISSLTTGPHRSGSLHYQGRAVDLVRGGGTTYAALASRLQNQGARVQCETATGAVVPCTASTIAHIHAEF